MAVKHISTFELEPFTRRGSSPPCERATNRQNGHRHGVTVAFLFARWRDIHI